MDRPQSPLITLSMTYEEQDSLVWTMHGARS